MYLGGTGVILQLCINKKFLSIFWKLRRVSLHCLLRIKRDHVICSTQWNGSICCFQLKYLRDTVAFLLSFLLCHWEIFQLLYAWVLEHTYYKLSSLLASIRYVVWVKNKLVALGHWTLEISLVTRPSTWLRVADNTVGIHIN